MLNRLNYCECVGSPCIVDSIRIIFGMCVCTILISRTLVIVQLFVMSIWRLPLNAAQFSINQIQYISVHERRRVREPVAVFYGSESHGIRAIYGNRFCIVAEEAKLSFRKTALLQSIPNCDRAIETLLIILSKHNYWKRYANNKALPKQYQSMNELYDNTCIA